MFSVYSSVISVQLSLKAGPVFAAIAQTCSCAQESDVYMIGRTGNRMEQSHIGCQWAKTQVIDQFGTGEVRVRGKSRNIGHDGIDHCRQIIHVSGRDQPLTQPEYNGRMDVIDQFEDGVGISLLTVLLAVGGIFADCVQTLFDIVDSRVEAYLRHTDLITNSAVPVRAA